MAIIVSKYISIYMCISFQNFSYLFNRIHKYDKLNETLPPRRHFY